MGKNRSNGLGGGNAGNPDDSLPDYRWIDDIGENGGYISRPKWDDVMVDDEPYVRGIVGALSDNPVGMSIDDIIEYYDSGRGIVEIGFDSGTNYSFEERGYINERDWDNLKADLPTYLDNLESDDAIYVNRDGNYVLNPYIQGLPSSEQLMDDAMDYYSDYETYMGL